MSDSPSSPYPILTATAPQWYEVNVPDGERWSRTLPSRPLAAREEFASARILIVDDELANIRLLDRILRRAGFTETLHTQDPREVRTLYREHALDLILLDLRMPEMDGFAVLAQLQELIPAGSYLPVLMLTGDTSAETKRRSMLLGAKDFIPKPFDAIEVIARIENLLETRRLHLRLQQQNQDLERKVQERTRQLQDALMLAEAANHAKSDFLARMSHELRTPLNSVIGFANVLMRNKGGYLQPQDVAYIERISANGKRLLALVNDVLDLSKIEAGRMELHVAPVRLERVIHDTLAELEGKFLGGRVVPRVSLPPTIAPLESDEGKLRQVLVNLLGNALKFTREGSVRIGVLADPVTHRPTRIDVEDTGIGIPDDRLSAIFESFEQAERSTGSEYGGTGLGLAISRSLCELMGYRLEVESVVGRGSRFSIILTPPAPPAPAEVEWTGPALVTDDRP